MFTICLATNSWSLNSCLARKTSSRLSSIGGFGVVAYPAQYDSSGIMSFIVNADGTVYQKDLGTNTAGVAKAMQTYNPDSSWKPVP